MTDSNSGTGWLLSALSALALTDVIDGHNHRAESLVTEFDAVASTLETLPGVVASGSADIARAFLAQETGDEEVFDRAKSSLESGRERLEHWPLLLIAEAGLIRRTRGAEQALVYLESAVAATQRAAPLVRPWSDGIMTYKATLHCAVGNLRRAEQLISEARIPETSLRLERARIAVFASNDVEALMLAQSVGDPVSSKRRRVERRLLLATAAWGCSREEEAIATLGSAAELITKYSIPTTMLGVPYEQLWEVALAARAAGVCDLLPLLESFPEVARAHRYQRLTESEIQSLEAITRHRNASQAAQSLFVTTGTVKKHLASVYRKLRVSDRDAAIVRASAMGIIEGTELCKQ